MSPFPIFFFFHAYVWMDTTNVCRVYHHAVYHTLLICFLLLQPGMGGRFHIYTHMRWHDIHVPAPHHTTTQEREGRMWMDMWKRGKARQGEASAYYIIPTIPCHAFAYLSRYQRRGRRSEAKGEGELLGHACFF